MTTTALETNSTDFSAEAFHPSAILSTFENLLNGENGKLPSKKSWFEGQNVVCVFKDPKDGTMTACVGEPSYNNLKNIAPRNFHAGLVIIEQSDNGSGDPTWKVDVREYHTGIRPELELKLGIPITPNEATQLAGWWNQS